MTDRKEISFIDLGRIEYKAAWDFQEKLFAELIEEKRTGQYSKTGYLIFCEHPHVFTLGKNGKEENLLINSAQLQRAKASFIRTNRGGDITYHGPGQLVGYPILNLELLGIGLKQYISLLEEVMIKTIGNYGIKGSRMQRNTGVWIDSEIPEKTRKICAIGVRSSRFVTMHGFALNINTDLRYFSFINPCGLTDKSVTSINTESGSYIHQEEVKKLVISNFIEVFKVLILKEEPSLT
jgi:lipoyl(octanoyl) transferase